MIETQVSEHDRIRPRPLVGRLRLLARWGRFAARSVAAGEFDFAWNAVRSQATLLAMSLADVALPKGAVECNICGWTGRAFYPNTGPGYDERNTICPGCRVLDRHRSLLEVLRRCTDFFEPGRRVIEVAPMRGFESLCLAQPSMKYTSFDLERHAMERGDITQLHYEDSSADFFVCFHVLEHIKDEKTALSEIRRVLKPGGIGVFQVPVDWTVPVTYEYDKPDPREVDHVRRYGQDFGERISRHGFEVQSVRVEEFVSEPVRTLHGLSSEPIYLAKKTSTA